MSNQVQFDTILGKFPDAKLLHEQFGMPTFEASPAQVHDLLSFLKNEGYGFLTTMCGLHFPEDLGRELGVMYQLHDLPNNRRIRVKTFFSIKTPEIPTVTDLFASAGWQERQEFDFFGINFIGHPDLRRILNVDDLDVFPMRKEYRLEDGTRTDKDDRYFGRDQHEGRTFEHRPDRVYLSEKN